MNIEFNKEIMIFRKEFNGVPSYTFSISRKNKNGDYENGYAQCQFKRDVEFANRTKIKVKQAWLTFYLSKQKNANGEDVQRTNLMVFINDFERVEEPTQEDPFAKYGKVEDFGSGLPF